MRGGRQSIYQMLQGTYRLSGDLGCRRRREAVASRLAMRTSMLALVLLAGSSLLAQSGLSGTWMLDQSAGGAGRGRAGGVPGFPLATTLTIKVSATEVAVDSDTGSAQSIQTSVYRLDGSETKVPGPLGWDTTARATLDGDLLKVTIRRSITGPNGPVGATVTEVYRVEGPVLTIERTLNNTTQKLVYRR